MHGAAGEVVRMIFPEELVPLMDLKLVAINGQPETLVTRNKKHFVGVGKRLGILVLSPAELLEKMRKRNQDGD
jgi:hypothetical protein